MASLNLRGASKANQLGASSHMTLSDEAHQDRGRHRRPQAELKDDLCACLMYSVHDTSPLVGGQIVPPASLPCLHVTTGGGMYRGS